MTRKTSQTTQLLDAMSRLSVPADDPAQESARRDQVVAHVASLIKEDHERTRRRWRTVAAIVAAAAALLIGIGISHQVHTQRLGAPTTASSASPAARARALEGTVLFVRDGELTPVASTEDALLEEGDELRTAAQAGATVALPTGVVANVGPATTLSMGSLGLAQGKQEYLVLSLGRIDVSVPKLAPGKSFSIRTPDAEVVVHGTRFSVAVAAPAPGAPAVTNVQVTEGRVSVLHAGAEITLTRGETWTPSPAVPEPPAPSPPATGSSASAARANPPAAATAAGTASHPVPPSSLADENRLFQAAMDAKRRGDDRAVVATLDQFLSRYPASPLAANARVERFRALKRLGDSSGAAREARRYLAENPDGFARDEARDTVLAPAPSATRPAP